MNRELQFRNTLTKLASLELLIGVEVASWPRSAVKICKSKGLLADKMNLKNSIKC